MDLLQRVCRLGSVLIAALFLLPSLASAHPSYAPHVHGSTVLTSGDHFIVGVTLLFLLFVGVVLAFYAQSKKF
jgi:hypothetical protein